MDITRLVLAADSTQIRQARGHVDQLGKSGTRVQRGLKSMTGTVAKLGTALAAAFSVHQIQRWARTALSDFADLERSQMRLTKQIELMGAGSWISAAAIEDMATRIDIATLESAANVRQAASVLMTAQGMTRESFERTMAVAVDMGEVLGLALPTSARYLVRAIGDTSGAMSMFRRYGIELEQSVQDQIAALQEAGQEAEAYGLLLSNLESRFDGAAEAAGKGLAGTMDNLGRATRQLREDVGKQLAPAVGDLVVEYTKWVDANKDVIAQRVDEYLGRTETALRSIVGVYNSIPSEIIGAGGVIGALLLGKGASFLVAAALLIPKFANSISGIGEAFQGEIGWLELATMNADELAAALERVRKARERTFHPIDYNDMKDSTASMAPSFAPMPQALETPQIHVPNMPDLIEPMEEMSGGYINAVREMNNVGKSWSDIEIGRIREQAAEWDIAYGGRIDTTEWVTAKINDIERQAQDQRLSMYQSAAGGIATTFEKIAQAGGKHSEAAFRIYQAFAIAQATIAGARAYMEALGDPTVPPTTARVALANVTAGLTAAQIGIIAAAQPPSYDMGGISQARGIYQTGDIQEAHVPIPSGKIPVEMGSGGRPINNTFNINVQSPNGSLDKRSLRQLQATLGRSIDRSMAEA